MKFQFCSDLHLEYERNRTWLKNNPLDVVGDVLLIAGDAFHLNQDASKLDFFKWASDNFNLTYLIPGNHEYYGGFDFSNTLEAFEINVFENVHIVNNKVIDIEDVQVICTSLWSKIEQYRAEVLRGMADFKVIRYGSPLIGISDYNKAHQISLDFLKVAVERPGKKLVMTHHMPSPHCIVPEFRNSTLNEAFCTDLTTLIADSDISYWIYGHSHRNIRNFEVSGTQVMCNQLGYVSYYEHTTFNPSTFLEL